MESGPPSPDDPDGPQAPPPGGPQAPPPGPGPQAPSPAPQAPPAPEAPGVGYGGPVPPGGWQQPIQQQATGWTGGAELSGWWRRVGAALLDALILTIPSILLVILVVAVFAGNDVAGWVTAVVSFLAYIVIALFYAPALMARQGEHNGQTWGKQALGITVVRDTGRPVELGFAFLREFVVKNLLFGVVGSFFFYIPTVVNYLWPLWDDQNRCLHDMIVKTHVVRR